MLPAVFAGQSRGGIRDDLDHGFLVARLGAGLVERPEYNPFSPSRQGGYTSSRRIHFIRDRIILTNAIQSERVRIVVAAALAGVGRSPLTLSSPRLDTTAPGMLLC